MKNYTQIITAFLFAVLMSLQLSAQIHIIEQQNFTFSPNTLNVNIGDTVRWVWTAGSHTTTSVSIPSGAQSWDNPLTQSETSFEYVVAESGTYNYQCTPHSSMGMTGSFVAFPSTRISRIVEKPAVKIYPNPAKDYIIIQMAREMEKCEIFVNDIIGNHVRSQLCSLETDTRIILEDLYEGIYVVSVYIEGSLVSEQKIIKIN
ncbi:MAG: plastocyanin/azurin family copper-binding protein [Bacteroidales bacterium]|nr:plastocyanin/azurin family copper-binding protein [Bacteroidales bacterium]